MHKATVKGCFIFFFLLFLVNFANADEEQLTFATLRVNSVNKGEVLIILRAQDILLQRNDIEKAGFGKLKGQEETIEGRIFVSLASLSHNISYTFDERSILLTIVVQPEYLLDTAIKVQSNRPEKLEYSQDFSITNNYGLNITTDESYNLFNETTVNIKGNFLYNTFLYSTENGIIRGLTNFNLDQPKKLVRITFGDQFAVTGDLGGGGLLAGIGYSRNFSLDPYFVPLNTLPTMSAVALTPSTLEVYSDNALILTQRVQPGPFSVNNIYPVSGSGNIRIVVRDILGNQREFLNPYYASSQVLTVGLSDYNFNLGFKRLDATTQSFKYANLPVFLGRYRYGLTKWLTLESRLEGEIENKLVSLGANGSMVFPIGSLQLGGAFSQQDTYSGYAASFLYSYFNRRFGLGLNARMLSENYANMGLDALLGRPFVITNAFIGLPFIARIGISLRGGIQLYHDNSLTYLAGINLSTQLFRRVNLFSAFSYYTQQVGPPVYEGSLGLSVSAGLTSISTAVQNKNEDILGRVSVNKSAPNGPGIGYRLDISGDKDQQLGQAGAIYQTDFGRYEANYSGDLTSRNTVSVGAAGGIIYLDKRVYFSRPLAQSFAVVKLTDVPNVGVYLNNQLAGRTDSSGYLLIPNLLPYYGNVVRLETKDLPLDYQIKRKEIVLATPFYGGALIEFGAYHVNFIVGHVTLQRGSETIIPAYGDLRIETEGEFVSPIGQEGEFYFENVPTGKYTVAIQFEGKVCKTQIEVPQSDQTMIELGSFNCVLPEGETPPP